MEQKRKRQIALFTACAAAAFTTIIAMDNRLTIQTYSLESEKLTGHIRLALLTDLHSCVYGEGQRELLDAVEAQHPDVVLLGGDIVDDELAPEPALTAVKALAAAYPVYYVTGNHECWSGAAESIRAELASYGVTVLTGACDTVLFQGQPVNLCGVDDPSVGAEAWEVQLERCARQADPAYFTILLTHRPERVEAYRAYPFDLILAGHAHGGQWRVPGLLNGLLAPNQGLFPDYAGGKYAIGEGTMIVSRGLARESTRIPRLFNPPELVMVDLDGK